MEGSHNQHVRVREKSDIFSFFFLNLFIYLFIKLRSCIYHACRTKVEGIFPGFFYICSFGGSLLVMVFQVYSDHLAYNQKFFKHYECKERNTMKEGVVIGSVFN